MGGTRREIFFEFFAFQNRAHGSGRVGRVDNFPPPPLGGSPPPPGTLRRGPTRSKFPNFLR